MKIRLIAKNCPIYYDGTVQNQEMKWYPLKIMWEE